MQKGISKTPMKKFPGTPKVKEHISKTPMKKVPGTRKVKEYLAKTLMKRPAAAASTAGEKRKATNPLAFPGDKKRPRLEFGKSLVYFSPGKFRVMVTHGDRVDKCFSHKACGIRVAWDRVCQELRRANPGV